jgi:hypothetical protein
MRHITAKVDCKRKKTTVREMSELFHDGELSCQEDNQTAKKKATLDSNEVNNVNSSESASVTTSTTAPGCEPSLPSAECLKESSVLLTPEKCEDDLSPDQYLKLIVLSNVGLSPTTNSALSLPSEFFPQLTPNQLSSFTNDVMTIVRDNNVDALKVMYENAGEDFTLQCCNRFGESVIHTACRRGFTEMVKFLIHDAKISIRCRDDCGRTPFHDAFWNPHPQFEIVSMLLEQDPLLLFLTDKRGNTPFEYARRDHWDTWRRFLYEKRNLINVDTSSIKKYLLQTDLD